MAKKIKVKKVKKWEQQAVKPENKGKFTKYCGGKVTTKCIKKAKKAGGTLKKEAVLAETFRKQANARKGKIRKNPIDEHLDELREQLQDAIDAGDKKKASKIKRQISKYFELNEDDVNAFIDMNTKDNPAVKSKSKAKSKVKKVSSPKVKKISSRERALYSQRSKTYEGYQGPDVSFKAGGGKYKTASEPIKVKGKEGRRFESINRSGERHKLPAGASAYIHEILEKEKARGVPLTQALAIGYAEARKKFRGMPKQNPAILKYINNPTPANLKKLSGVNSQEIEDAARMYKKFVGREPEWIEEVNDKNLPAFMKGRVWTKLADADAIQYKSDKWHKGKHDFYKHDFGKGNELLTNPEGTALVIINKTGKLKVKPEGIVG